MQKKYINRFHSFEKSLKALAELKNRDLDDDFVVSGGVQKFSLTFDIAWKVMKDIVVGYFKVSAFASGSPRETLRTAQSVGLIQDDVWMHMLKDRNDLTHDYDSTLASEAIYRIRDVYIDVFEQFRNIASAYMQKMQEDDLEE